VRRRGASIGAPRSWSIYNDKRQTHEASIDQPAAGPVRPCHVKAD
jgi:hypothetical protein